MDGAIEKGGVSERALGGVLLGEAWSLSGPNHSSAADDYGNSNGLDRGCATKVLITKAMKASNRHQQLTFSKSASSLDDFLRRIDYWHYAKVPRRLMMTLYYI